MSKLKQLKEKRASIFSQIDQLRTAADGREMTAEEQQRWDTLLADYNKVDKEVEAEERFEQIRRHQLEQAENNPAHTPEDRSAADRQYEEAFRAYLLSGSQGVTPEQRTLLQERAGLQGLTAGVLIPSTLAGSIEKAQEDSVLQLRYPQGVHLPHADHPCLSGAPAGLRLQSRYDPERPARGELRTRSQ